MFRIIIIIRPSSGLQQMVLIKVHTLVIPMDPIGITKVCILIYTMCCKPDDGRIRPKHVAS